MTPTSAPRAGLGEKHSWHQIVELQPGAQTEFQFEYRP